MYNTDNNNIIIYILYLYYRILQLRYFHKRKNFINFFHRVITTIYFNIFFLSDHNCFRLIDYSSNDVTFSSL